MFSFFVENNPIFKVAFNHLKYYPSPTALTYFWSFGSLSGICLVIQILTGVFLAMHYTSYADLSFFSVEHIMRDINYGWLVRYLHSNGASMFFAVMYLHIARGIYYKSFKFKLKEIWISGIIILLLTMAAAFIGYVLPWGQMSYWGATVITNIFSAIPVIGVHLVYWLWGGFSVGAATLSRFFSLHYLLPFIIIVVVLVHLAQLHESGSSNPFPLHFRPLNDSLYFYPYFVLKDLVGLLLFCIFFSAFVFFSPNYLGHSDNYIEANPLVTPEHIVPEWYFLPFYAILRSIPNKLGGIVAMLGAILIFVILPYIFRLKEYFLSYVLFVSEKKISKFNSYIYVFLLSYIYQFFVFCFYVCFLGLGWIGAKPVEDPFVNLGFYLTVLYFILVFILVLLA